jgi:hypothetical protein
MHSVSSDLRVATATRRLPRKKVARELSASRCPTDPGGRALHQLGPIPRPPDQQSLNHESNESHESNPSIPIRPIRAIRGPSLDVRSATHHPRPLAPSAAKKPWRPWQRWRLVESSLQRPASRVDSREPSTEPLRVSPSPRILVCFRPSPSAAPRRLEMAADCAHQGRAVRSRANPEEFASHDCALPRDGELAPPRLHTRQSPHQSLHGPPLSALSSKPPPPPIPVKKLKTPQEAQKPHS